MIRSGTVDCGYFDKYLMNVVKGKHDASQATVVQVNSTTIRGGNISQPLSILSASYTRESELQKSVTSRLIMLH